MYDTSRRQAFEELQKQRFDLIVIGGGITGAGIARDAALRGLQVVLVEKSDFGSGTSSKSSKLIHGGLRYLQHAEFGLVFEAVSERTLLLKLAPHLVKPQLFWFRLQRPLSGAVCARLRHVDVRRAVEVCRARSSPRLPQKASGRSNQPCAKTV